MKANKLKNALLENVKLTVIAAFLSVINTLLFHIPFFSYILEHIDCDFNGVFIFSGLIIIMLVGNFLTFYLLLYLGRTFGKVLLSIIFICNSVALYFINTYDVLIDYSMMGNVFNTHYSEASGFVSVTAFVYLIFLGIVPGILVWLPKKINYGSFKRFLANIGISFFAIAFVSFSNITNWTWVDNNSTVAGSLILPWSYIVNSVIYKNKQRERTREEIKLPDAIIANDEKDVVLLVIGESARRDHFSLYGYERETNPLLGTVSNLTTYKARSAATYTTGGVKAILDYTDTDKLYEILPNYLYRAGVDVIWRANNWGQPPLHIDKYYDMPDIVGEYGLENNEYDENLLVGLPDIIRESKSNKVLIVLHTNTSHGPLYSKKYPSQFEKFTPVNTIVEMSKCPKNELLNAYDNSICYVDYLLFTAIENLKEVPEWNSTMIYVSDHGESLGENNLYMHGVPMSIAPAEQYEIPFIVWTSNPERKLKDYEEISQYFVFHSVLKSLGVESPIYDEEKNIFE